MKGVLGNSISRVHSMLRGGAITACELCNSSLRRAEQVKPLNAFISVTDELARYSAHQSSKRFRKGISRGLLDGIPIAVKDNFCTMNVKTTCGSRMLESFIPKYNATVVQKLGDAGAVLLGKCNMDEFAMGCGTVDSVFGPTKNVWQSGFDSSNGRLIVNDTDGMKTANNWYISGGSSGGSAVAVASGAAFLALGSDTGGSTRNPAAYCGVVGFKPTFGVLSRHGLIPLVNSMDVPGILTRTTEDASVVLNVLAGWDPKDSTSVELPEIFKRCENEINIKEVCIGIPEQYQTPGLSEEVLTTWNYVADLFDSAGSKVVKVSLPHTSSSISCYSVLNQCEVASNMAKYDGIEFGFRSFEHHSTEELFADTRREGFGEVVRSRILAGNYFLLQRNYQKYFVQAMKVRRLIVNDFEKAWSSGVDVLLTPTTLSEPPKYSEFIALENQQQCVMQDYCTQPVNLAGCPAVSLPIRLSRNGLPISLQLIGRTFRDNMLLSIAEFVEKAVNFPKLGLE